MGSSADEADAGGKQPPQAVRPPDTAAVPLHEDIPSSEDSEASKPMLLKQSQQRQRNRSSARPPGKAHAARSGKPHGKNSIAPVPQDSEAYSQRHGRSRIWVAWQAKPGCGGKAGCTQA